MAAVSSRDLRNNTAEVLRRVEAGERVQITVNRRPVAELVPLDRPQWVSGALMQRMLRGIAADPELLEELQVLREQVVGPVGPLVVLDTSVLIAGEQGRALARPVPEAAALSVVTLAELD